MELQALNLHTLIGSSSNKLSDYVPKELEEKVMEEFRLHGKYQHGNLVIVNVHPVGGET